MKFEVGDKVKTLVVGYQIYEIDFELPVGSYGEIVQCDPTPFSDRPFICRVFACGRHWWYYADELEKVE